MIHVVILGSDDNRAESYINNHADTKRKFICIGDKNADYIVKRDIKIKEAVCKCTHLLPQLKPQDCHALVNADELVLCEHKNQLKVYAEYLTAVFSMRAKTNAGQPLVIIYVKEITENVQELITIVGNSLQPEAYNWFQNMVRYREYQ